MEDTPRSAGPLVRVEDVEVKFPVGRSGLRLLGGGKTFLTAVDGVSLSIERGETLGLVGESGSGKSTLGRTMSLLTPPTSGDVLFDGHSVLHRSRHQLSELRQRIQIVFQDPYGSLDPRQKIGNTVAEPLLINTDLTARQRREKTLELLALVGTPANAVERYPHEFSGGQRQRIAIARALALDPDFIVCDEPISALDVSIQAQIINLLEDLQSRLGLTYLFIAHDLKVVEHISHRVAVMYLGQIVELAPAAAFYTRPVHPYTQALLRSRPTMTAVRTGESSHAIQDLKGEPPSPVDPPKGCRFNTRCPFAVPEICAVEEPPLVAIEDDHQVACHFGAELASGELSYDKLAEDRMTSGAASAATR